jgi:membrane-associated phospholipid phosphatase
MTDDARPTSPPSRLFDRALLPQAGTADGRRWTRRLVIWLGLFVLLAVLLRYDVTLLRWRFAVLPEEPGGLLKEVLYSLRDAGQMVPILVGIVIVARCDRRRKTIIACILTAQLLANIAYNGGKFTVARYRPFATVDKLADAANPPVAETQRLKYALDRMNAGDSWIGWSPGLRSSRLQSFPSGHSGAAFAFAGVLAWFYPSLARLVWTLAAGCALSRFIDNVHWPSDCLTGAMIGYVAAWIALRPQVWSLRWRSLRKPHAKHQE